jgi:hypothetical protein
MLFALPYRGCQRKGLVIFQIDFSFLFLVRVIRHQTFPLTFSNYALPVTCGLLL